MAPGVLCVEKRTQGKGALPAARLSPAEGGDGREGAPERALFPEEGNLWVKNGRNANEEIGKRDFDLLKKDQNSVRT